MILDAVIGWESNIGCWSRVEGTLPKINPNMPHARVESDRLFDDKGRFIPQCSVLGRGVKGTGFFIGCPIRVELTQLTTRLLNQMNNHNK